MTTTTMDPALKGRILETFNMLSELMRDLGIEAGINEAHARTLRYYQPGISTPVGNLGAQFRNVEVSRVNGRTVAYHQAEYLWQGQTIRCLVRCEVDKDGRAYVAQAFPPKPAK